MFALLGQFHFEILKDPLRRKTAGIGSKTEFVLPVNDAGSPSGDNEWLDAGCSEGEQAEDFCDHGAGMLAGLVGHLRGEEIFLKTTPRGAGLSTQGRTRLPRSPRVESLSPTKVKEFHEQWSES